MTVSRFKRAPFLRACLLLPLLAVLLAACGQQDSGGDMPPAPVRTESFERQNVEVGVEYAGRARGAREVEVRARVEGILLERLYNEGQTVSRGEALFRIDTEPYQIALQRAEAELANAQAALQQAEREWQRIDGLFRQNAISAREHDQARSALELAEAGRALAEAGRASARLNLEWTEVTAPIDGATGLETLPEGSLISRGSLLTTITQTDPIHVRFALPERDALLQQAVRKALSEGGSTRQRMASLTLPDGSTYSETGVVDFTDSSIDPRTGSVSARAVFPNPLGKVVPGQFLRVRLVLQELEDVLLLPPEAIGQSQAGARVFIVDEQRQARERLVELGPMIDGRQVVFDGIEAGDAVIVSGLVNLRDGMPVDPGQEQAQASPEAH